jgi:hypothetical protein
MQTIPVEVGSQPGVLLSCGSVSAGHVPSAGGSEVNKTHSAVASHNELPSLHQARGCGRGPLREGHVRDQPPCKKPISTAHIKIQQQLIALSDFLFSISEVHCFFQIGILK